MGRWAAVAMAIVLGGCRAAPVKKVIVLGIDGMDPHFVEAHWDALPNLRQLAQRGSFQRLGTTMPPQSPVAWSSFITGLEPDAHGIFDFVQREPANLELYSSMGRTEEPRYTLPLGPYILPLSKPRVETFRKGTAFWEALARRRIPVTVVRMPTNYPPLAAGRALAGMGTPDLRGTLGTFTFYTNDAEEISRPVSGGQIVKIELHDGHAELPLDGPPNSLRKDHRVAAIRINVDVDATRAVARVQVGDQAIAIAQGEWSAWLTADFPLLPPAISSRGMFRIFAKQLHPQFELYVSPVNVDPESPALPVAVPASYGRDLARHAGRFFTLGIPEDTSALRQTVFDLPQFLSQTRLVFEDEQRLLRQELRSFEGGLLFFYFSSVDQNSHMLWGKHDPELLNVYREIDECVGEAQRSAPEADLIVLSDHGFASFDRAVHLNAWLRARGYLALRGRAGDDTTLEDVDWEHTRAYALGLNGLYVNLRGREPHGIVASGAENELLKAELRAQLLAYRDPENGRTAISAVYESHPARQNLGAAPDLIVGYSAGYRGSWQTGLGATPAIEIEDNNDAWIGDHCMDPAAVPGVLFTSRGGTPAHPRLEDVTNLVTRLFQGL